MKQKLNVFNFTVILNPQQITGSKKKKRKSLAQQAYTETILQGKKN